MLAARIGWALLQWGRSPGAQHRCSASLFARAAAAIGREAQLGWQRSEKLLSERFIFSFFLPKRGVSASLS